MEKATGELNLTVITVLALAALIALFWVLWPTLQNWIQGTVNNTQVCPAGQTWNAGSGRCQ